MKVVFMGTPDFAVASLQAIIDGGHEVVLVVTQPDREKGRGKKVAFSPVKECALANSIPVFQPVRIKAKEAVAELKKYEADIFIVAAFGQILSKEILDMPKYGCVNVHASLLPKYRGAAPIQWSILDGEYKTGVTLMQMNEGLDTGDMIASVEVPITLEDTGDSLHDKLSIAGAKLLQETLPLIEQGNITLTPQVDSESTYAKMLSKDLGRIDFRKPVMEIDRLVRALNSWPSAYTQMDGKTLKIWEVMPVADMELTKGYAPGTVINISKNSFDIVAGDGVLKVTSLQIEGKKRMGTGDFLRGYKVIEGTVLPS